MRALTPAIAASILASLLASPLASTLGAQQTAADVAPPASCTQQPMPIPPTGDQRRAARDLVSRAQEAAIVSDDATARDLYQRAARLDPTDPAIAYALARSYESARDVRAIAEYCRFLALQPAAPEAPDVRRRIATLTFELAPHGATVVTQNGPVTTPPAPGSALAYGILFPGGGQYYTHRPALGVLITAAAAGAIYYALQEQTVTNTVTAIDPNGQPYQYSLSHTDRPNMAVGFGAAAAISLVAAIEASSHARAARRVASIAHATIVSPTPNGVALGARLTVSR